MTNEENKTSSSSHGAKRPYTNMINNCPGPKIYTANKAEYKLMVRSLTSTPRRSSGQTSLRVPTQAQVSNPQPIRLNDASIPPGSSRQTSLPLPTRAHVSNPRSMGLYDPPNRFPAAQWSSLSSSRSLPYPFPPASVWPTTSAAGTSNAQAPSSQPSLPSPPLPPSVPTSSSSLWSPPPARLVSARLPEYPPSLPPAPPQEQGAMVPSFDDIELFLNEDNDYNFAACSPLPYVTGTSNGEQQREAVPPPVLTNQPSGNLNVPVPQNGLTEPPLEHGSNSLYENVAPQVHASPPSTDPLNGPNYQQEGIAPPVHAMLRSSNVPPLVAPSRVHNKGPSESQLGTVPGNVPFGSLDLSNYTTYEEKQRCLAQMGFGTVPSWHLNWNSYPRIVFPSTNNPSSSSAPANLPPGNLQG
ncbi:hypothetical protein N665_0089s0043 [Sinapis alba]|nr:hypothetical protein N665_0089s0043 [Sinapis alba]